MENRIRIEIVTPVHNRREVTLQCLRSIARLNSDGLDIHTVIVDDGSTDGTSEAIAEQFPDVEVIPADGSLQFTEATNVGVRAALERNPKYVLMINDDQIFDQDAVRCLVETAELHPRSVVGPLLLLWDTPHKLFQTAPIWNTLSGGWRHWRHQTVWTVPKRTFEVEGIVGNCVLVPTDAIHEQGLMNSKRYPIYGDAEYTPRLRRNGWRLLIDPRSRVFCQPNTAPAKISRLSLRDKFHNLVIDTYHPHNLRRRFRAAWDGAPNKLSGLAAFAIFFVRLVLRRNVEGEWSELQKEIPLYERFKHKLVDSRPDPNTPKIRPAQETRAN
jgi:GT2 family glycosyltransferase